ncbi:MAG: glycosyltransferase family 4 protein [Solirubrobacterales bacterium]|nr:glycosyltransferase family 4 protein [Solirubrobacterales bacterium]
MKPLLFVTGHLPAYRAGALARLHEREGIELALFGGRAKHGGGSFSGELPFAQHEVRPLGLEALVRSGRYRAVVCPTGGRLAPLATWAGARRAGIPLILWASLWAHPRTAAHALSYLPLRRLYRSADAVVTYGPHVSDYVTARGARNVHVAPQSVDNDFWSAQETGHPSEQPWPEESVTRFLFVGRPAREKGLGVLLDAWRASGLAGAGGALALVGVGDSSPRARRPRAGPVAGDGDGVRSMGTMAPVELRSTYAAADVLVLPSIRTRTFREPWGLVVNEAMNRGLAVIASDAVGAVAGGLVRDGENGLVVRAADNAELAAAIKRLAGDPELRTRLGRAGAEDVRAFSHDAWAEGFSRALATVGLARGDW